MGIVELWTIASSIVTVASIIARFTPTPKDDKIVAKARKVVEALSIPIKK